MIEDVSDNNFQPLVEHIINNNISINIDGRAGTGNQHLLNKFNKNSIKEKFNISH